MRNAVFLKQKKSGALENVKEGHPKITRGFLVSQIYHNPRRNKSVYRIVYRIVYKTGGKECQRIHTIEMKTYEI